MKLGRNSKCHCGSDMKYKKCCLNKEVNQNFEENQFINKVKDKSHLVELLVKGKDDNEIFQDFKSLEKYVFSHQNKQFRDGNKIDYIKRFKNLPTDLKNKLKILLQHIPIMDGSCYYNSLYLSTLIDGVEKVDGWYGSKNYEESVVLDKDLGGGIYTCHLDISNTSETNKLSVEIFNSNEVTEKEVLVWDDNEKILWYKHSWNKYNDIYFDISCGTIDWGVNEDKKWREYVELPNTQKPTKELDKKILTMCDMESWLDGCKNWVLNRGVLNKLLFDMTGSEGEYKSKYIVDYDESEIKEHQMKTLELVSPSYI